MFGTLGITGPVDLSDDLVIFVLLPALLFGVIVMPADPVAVIAVEDENGLTSAVGPGGEFSAADELTLVGSDGAVQQFLKKYDVSPGVDGDSG